MTYSHPRPRHRRRTSGKYLNWGKKGERPPAPPLEPEIVLCDYGDLNSRAPACENPPADGEDQCDYHLYVLHERGY